MPRILVVSYSRTGHTRQVAASIAAAAGADLEEIVDPTPRAGLFGYLRSGREAFFRTIPPIEDARHNPAGYDLVVIGTPIWNMSLSAPVRGYLRKYRAALPAVAFVCTCGGAGMERVFRQMAEESGKAPVATLAVREHDLTTPALSGRIERFAGEIRAAIGPAPAAKSA
jgi:flavodoxin